MSNLIDGLLSLFRIRRTGLTLTRVNLSGLAHTIVERLKSEEPTRQISVSIQDNVKVIGDPHLLNSVLDNLLSNAWKFTSKKDLAVVEFGCHDESHRKVYFVKDNGAGFETQFAGNKLFKPFQRLHGQAEFPGTGIGLATVFKIIQRHGGNIWADSEVGKGTQFSFTLPETYPDFDSNQQ
jgi:signal transduction histidine kinase